MKFEIYTTKLRHTPHHTPPHPKAVIANKRVQAMGDWQYSDKEWHRKGWVIGEVDPSALEYYEWEIEFNNLDELSAFLGEVGECVISKGVIEIYDDYRE